MFRNRPRFRFHGDKRNAESLYMQAWQFLEAMKPVCPGLSQKGPFRRVFQDGTEYLVREVFGQQFVDVYVPVVTIVQVEERNRAIWFKITLNGHECTKEQRVGVVDSEGEFVPVFLRDDDNPDAEEIDDLEGKYIEVEGAFPTDENGMFCLQWQPEVENAYLALSHVNANGEKVFEYYQEVIKGEHDKQVACGIRERYDDVSCDGYMDISPIYPWNQFVVLSGSDFEVPDHITENKYLKAVYKKLSDITIGTFDIIKDSNKAYKIYDFTELAVTKMQKLWTHNENFTTCEWPESGLDRTKDTRYGVDNTECSLPVFDCISTGSYDSTSAFYRMIGVQTIPYIHIWRTDEPCVISEEYPRTQYYTLCEVYMGCLTDDTSIEKFICLSDAYGRNVIKSEDSLIANAGPSEGAMWKEKDCVDEDGSAEYAGRVCLNNEVGTGPASAQYILQVVETPVERI